MDADSLASACGLLGLDVPEQKKGNRKLLLKYILMQPNFEDVEGFDDGGSSWYAKLHHHLTFFFQKRHGTFSLKQKPVLSENGLFDSSLLFHNFI